MININILITDADDTQLLNETHHDFEKARERLEAIEYEHGEMMSGRCEDE